MLLSPSHPFLMPGQFWETQEKKNKKKCTKNLWPTVCVCLWDRTFCFWFSLEFYSFLFRTFALSRRIGKIYTLPRLPTKVSDFLVLKNYNNDNSKRSYGIFVSSWKIVWLFGFRYTQREVEFRFLKNLNFGFALHWFCCFFRVIRVCGDVCARVCTKNTNEGDSSSCCVVDSSPRDPGSSAWTWLLE